MNVVKTFMKVFNQESFKSKIIIVIRGLKYVMKRYLFRLSFSNYKVHGNKMYLNLNDNGISRTLAIFGTREKEHLYILKRELSNRSSVLDLGANIGYYSLIMSDLNPNGLIYAVEPEECNYNQLNINIDRNKKQNIKTFKMAIGDTDNENATMYLSNLSNVHTFIPNDVENYMSGKTADIKMLSLLSFIKENNAYIDLIRMDIEGFETKILKNLIDVVKSFLYKPAVLFELHPNKYTKTNTINPKLKELFKLGYYFKYLASSHKDEFNILGYKPVSKILTDGTIRYIYKNIRNKDSYELLKISRTAYLDKKLTSSSTKFLERKK